MSSPILYISYDGMLEPLGQSQVLAYLEKFALGRRIYLLSFEKAADWDRLEERLAILGRIKAAGIAWHPRRYHSRPSVLATAWDLFIGALTALWLILRYRVSIVHARSYVPALMAWMVTRVTSARFLFDMRGFWVDERVDGGLWPSNGRLYRAAKWFERRFLLAADHIVSLTHAAVLEMSRFDYLEGRSLAVTVIPTCTDLEKFKPLRLQKEAGFNLGYVGSAGTWYLFDITVACFVQLRKLRADARMLIINRNEHDYIRNCLDCAGVPPDAVELLSADHWDVPLQMARMHATAFFIKPVFSKLASAPTKLGEFLGCGIPCLSNAGVGDMAEILEDDRVGVAIRGFETEALAAGLRRLLGLLDEPGISHRCIESAQRHFSLERGVAQYREVYQSLDSVK